MYIVCLTFGICVYAVLFPQNAARVHKGPAPAYIYPSFLILLVQIFFIPSTHPQSTSSTSLSSTADLTISNSLSAQDGEIDFQGAHSAT